MSYQLRPLHLPEDLERIQELLAESRLRPAALDRMTGQDEEVGQGAALRLGAVDPLGRMVGFGQVMRTPQDPPGQFALIIAVEPYARGHGAGTLLLEELEAFARRHGATRICTEVRNDDASALTFMQHWGYELAGQPDPGFFILTKPF